jgi:hypothetical protein
MTYDPIVLAHARALLASTPEGACAYLDADLRNMDAVLADAVSTLDFSQPVAVLFIGVLHLVADAEDPSGLIATALAACSPGSYLALTQPAADVDAEIAAEGARRYNQQVTTPQTRRTYEQTLRFFDGLTLVDPGVVQFHRWRPESGATGLNESVSGWCGVARKD